MSESNECSYENLNFEEYSGEICTNPENRITESFYNSLLPIIVKEWINEGDVIAEEYELDLTTSDYSVKPYILKNVEVKFKNGNVYCGTAFGRRLEGEGEFRWKDGSSFKGSFSKNHVIGNGAFFYSNGARYIGEVSYGHRHGKGCLIIDELTYSGSFSSALFHGPGKLQVNARGFDGEFLCHKPHFGSRNYDNGIFNGLFDDFGSRKCGKFLFKNNDTYEGHWYEDQFNDFGIYKWNIPGKYVNKLLAFTSPCYIGYWLDGKRHGIGMLEFDERMIFCNWKDDKKTGPGIILAANGDLYASDNMFFKDQYKAGQKVICLKKAKSLIEDLLFYFFPKDEVFGSCKCCKKKANAFVVTHAEILRDKIIELMAFSKNQNAELVPIFLPKYSIDFTNSVILKCVQQLFQTKANEKDFISVEIKCINQAITDNLKELQIIFQIYATFSMAVQRNDFVLTRLGLWQMYRDIFAKMPEVNVSALIDEVESACNIFVRDSHNPCEKVFFWQFLRHVLYIVIKLNGNIFVRFRTKKDRFTFSGYFATMLVAFLKEMQFKEILTFKNSIGMIHEQPKLALTLLEKLKKFEQEPTIRTVYRFYTKYSNVESKGEGLKGNLKLIDDAIFMVCAQEIFPIIMQDGYFREINFRVTLLEFFEILLRLFEADVFHRKLNLAVELEKLRIKTENMEEGTVQSNDSSD